LTERRNGYSSDNQLALNSEWDHEKLGSVVAQLSAKLADTRLPASPRKIWIGSRIFPGTALVDEDHVPIRRHWW